MTQNMSSRQRLDLIMDYIYDCIPNVDETTVDYITELILEELTSKHEKAEYQLSTVLWVLDTFVSTHLNYKILKIARDNVHYNNHLQDINSPAKYKLKDF